MDLLDKLKKKMVAEAEEHNFDACEYYETILQHKEKLVPLLNDAEKFSDVAIYYHEDDTNGYTNGCFSIQFNNGCQSYAKYVYEITLKHDPRHWGYCGCEPSDEGYNPIYKCCGDGCDWDAPSIDIERIDNIADFSFDGAERDLWELRNKWSGNEELEIERLTQQRQYIENEMQRLLEEKNLIDEKLNKGD